MKALLGRALVGFALLLPVALAAQVALVPQLTQRVTDLTRTLTGDQSARLEQKLAAFESSKGSQIAVLLVPTTRPESIEQYGIRVVDIWKGGRKGVDDGALLLVAKDDRELRIEVGRGLEGALTDLVSNRIVEDIIVPHFKQGDYYGGIDAGVDAMIRVVEGEPLPPPTAQPRSGERGFGGQGLESLLIIGFILVFVVGGILRSIFGKLPAALMVGGALGFIAWMIVASLAASVVVAIIAFVFSLFAGMSGLGRGGMRPGGWGGGYGGGLGGGGGWGGGSGGSWGGGGGTFGGGGASGRW